MEQVLKKISFGSESDFEASIVFYYNQLKMYTNYILSDRAGDIDYLEETSLVWDILSLIVHSRF